MVTNSNYFPNYKIVDAHGIISIRMLCGNSAFERLAGSDAWECTFTEAVESLEKKAAQVGGNAVICVREEIFKFSQGFLGDVVLILTGTAVTVESEHERTDSSGSSIAIEDAPPIEKVNAETDAVDPNYIFCPKCSTRQRSNRSRCLECGAYFEKQ